MIAVLLRSVLVPIGAVAFALALGYGFLLLTGYPAGEIFAMVYREGLTDPYGISHVLRFASLLTFAGLAVAIGFRAGLFNIGVEGQVVIGGLAAALAGLYLKSTMDADVLDATPWALLALGGAFAAAAGGALWGAIPGVLRAWTGAHEVITTIMLNFIAYSLVNYLLRPGSSLAAPGRMQTPRIPSAARWPRASELVEDFAGSPLNAVSLLAPVACLLLWLVLRYTNAGFALRASGANPEAAEAAGFSNKAVIIGAMVAGGAVAGLVGLEHVAGQKGYMEEGFSGGVGFMGIAVALLGRNHPLGVIIAALLFGLLDYGRIVAGGIVPGDIFRIVQAIIIFTVLMGNGAFDRAWAILATRRRQHTGTEKTNVPA